MIRFNFKRLAIVILSSLIFFKPLYSAETNELLKVRGSYISNDEFIFRIFDRWGNLVFETYDPTEGWDGTYKEKACDPGVFVYYFEALCIDNQKYFEKGNITLIK